MQTLLATLFLAALMLFSATRLCAILTILAILAYGVESAHHLLKMKFLIRESDHFSFYEGHLIDPEPTNGNVRFCVLLKDREGESLPVRTAALAAIGVSLILPKFTELEGRKVLVAYHESKQQFVVAKLFSAENDCEHWTLHKAANAKS